MTTVKLKVNTQRLVAGLRYAFTSQEVLIGELLQNARRAGATKVDIQFIADSATLVVEDDGCGIADFQQLLTVAESGWDESVQVEESPFGMGFFSALFSAEKVEVISRGKRLAFESSEALSFDDLKTEVVGLDIPGTRITLAGLKKLNNYSMDTAIDRYCKGFNIPVTYNGRPQARPHAPSALSLVTSDIGLVSLAPTKALVAYLQGIRVFSRYSSWNTSEDEANIVHLAPSFKGRMPDRNVLVDSDEANRRIETGVRFLWRSKMLAAKSEMDPQAFADTYWELARDWGLIDIMDDVPYLPAVGLSEFVGYPESKRDYEDDYISAAVKGVSQHQVISKEVVLCVDRPLDEGDSHWPAAMMARNLNWVHVELSSRNHWAEPHVLNLTDLDVQVDFKKLHRFRFNGKYVCCDIILCDQYTLHDDECTVVIDDEAVYTGDFIVVPAKTDGEEALRQVSNYMSDDQFQDEDHNRDCDLLRRRVRAERAKLRGDSQAETLAEVLSAGDIDTFDSLRNGVFVVRLGQRLKPAVTQVNEHQLGCFNQFLESLQAVPAS